MDIPYESRKYLERSLALKAAETSLSQKDFNDWRLLGFTYRALCHKNKVFCAWEHSSKGPVVVDSLTVDEIEVDTATGFGVRIRNAAKEYQWLEHAPHRVFDLPVFAHVPFMPDVSYLPRKDAETHLLLKFPIVYKTQGNPDRPVEGLLYLTQIGEFRATYPQFADLRL